MPDTNEIDPELQSMITEWYDLKKEIEGFKPTIAKEMILRRKIGEILFPDPKEGVNTQDLPEDWKIKYTHKLDYKVDEAALPAVEVELQKMLINTDSLIRRNPELVLKAYRGLTEEVQKVLQQALIIKPSTPTLELVPPK